ncbi:MAG: metallophosphoesterase family protein [Pseudonocardiaceae bacterium]
MFQRLHDDLDALAGNHELRPDLMVITGDLAEWDLRSEFDQVAHFLTAPTEAVELPRRHVAIVPGNHDVNRPTCAAHFLHEQADEREPVPPYWPKWEHFAAAFEQYYEGVDGVSFTPDEPWTLFEMPDLAVVVAGLNSTMAESHLDSDHYGWVGEHQLRWFADRLARYRDQGWLQLAALHHNAVRGAVADEENLRDAGDLDRWLGQPGLVNLLLHGHTHDGQLHRLSSGSAGAVHRKRRGHHRGPAAGGPQPVPAPHHPPQRGHPPRPPVRGRRPPGQPQRVGLAAPRAALAGQCRHDIPRDAAGWCSNPRPRSTPCEIRGQLLRPGTGGDAD